MLKHLLSSSESKQYFLPVDLKISKARFDWIPFKVYAYKIYSDESEKDFTEITLYDYDGFIVGKHMPTKLNTLYDKTAQQFKNGTVKAVSEISNVITEVADIAKGSAADVKEDVMNTAKSTVSIATRLFDGLKRKTKEKLAARK